jgi:hypothetical protein
MSGSVHKDTKTPRISDKYVFFLKQIAFGRTVAHEQTTTPRTLSELEPGFLVKSVSSKPRPAELTNDLLASYLFGRCGYVYVNFLVAIKEPPAKHKQSSNNHDHEDHQHGHYSRTSSATIVSHKTFLLYMKLGCNQPGSPRFLSCGRIAPKQS